MSATHPKETRRRILEALYEKYHENPLHMTTPAELLEASSLEKKDLPANIFYLHERQLVELMVGYNPPMFDVVRISPEGIDLVEDEVEFNRQFPRAQVAESESLIEARTLTLALVKEIEASSLRGARRDWMIDDLKLLRDALRHFNQTGSLSSVHAALERLQEYVEDGLAKELPALSLLARILAEDIE